MSHRAAAWLAWSVCAFSVALTLLDVLLNLLTPPIPMREFPHWLLGYAVFYTIGLQRATLSTASNDAIQRPLARTS